MRGYPCHSPLGIGGDRRGAGKARRFGSSLEVFCSCPALACAGRAGWSNGKEIGDASVSSGSELREGRGEGGRSSRSSDGGAAVSILRVDTVALEDVGAVFGVRLAAAFACAIRTEALRSRVTSMLYPA